VLNTCYNCVDRHVEKGRGEQLALVYDSPLAQTRRKKITYRELQA
jgi:propionyl-CoA synthetase